MAHELDHAWEDGRQVAAIMELRAAGKTAEADEAERQLIQFRINTRNPTEENRAVHGLERAAALLMGDCQRTDYYEDLPERFFVTQGSTTTQEADPARITDGQRIGLSLRNDELRRARELKDKDK